MGDQMVLTAPKRSAPEPTDQLMVHQAPHALESNPMTSHTTTLTQPPEDHTRPPVTSPRPPQSQPPLTHGQLPRPSSRLLTMPSHPLKPRKSPSSRPHTDTPTPPSTEINSK